MKNRLIGSILALAMLLCILPMAAHAEEAEIFVGGVAMKSGDYLPNGAAEVATTQPDGGYAHYADGVLTLVNFVYTGEGTYNADEMYCYDAVNHNGDLKLILQGENSLTVTAAEEANSYGVVVWGSLTVEEASADASLTVKGCRGTGLWADENLTVNSGQILVSGLDGFYANDDIFITDGTVHLEVEQNGIQTEEGNITLDGGTVEISAQWDGISADRDLVINDGMIVVAAEGDGISANNGALKINGGVVDVTSGDDGIYGYAEDDKHAYDVVITGGDVTVHAYESAVNTDSGKGLQMTGGRAMFICTADDEEPDSDNFAVDLSGGTFVYDAVPLALTASENASGTPIAEFVAENMEDYDYVKIEARKFTVTLPTGTGYTAVPADGSSSPVEYGDSYSFTVTLADGYEKGESFAVKANGKTLTEASGKYILAGIQEDQTVTVEGVEKKAPPFTDVPKDAYYYSGVAWAVEKAITTGMSETTFVPDGICTRAQVVTFLWRSCGSPKAASANNPFTDVPADQWYTDAVLWAVEQGITTGTSATTFNPDDGCTRGQVAAFLWRSQGKPASDANNIFTDIAPDAYYYDAVLWAVENNITNGMGDGIFVPDATCTRAQIVTFLYRALSTK